MSYPLDEVHEICDRLRTTQRVRALRDFLEFWGLIQKRENFVCQTLRVQLALWNHASSAGLLHGLGVAKLMTVCCGAERDKDGGTPSGGNFGHRDGA